MGLGVERPFPGVDEDRTAPIPWADPTGTQGPRTPPPSPERKRRRALLAVAGTVAFVITMLLAVNLAFGVPALPFAGDQKAKSEPTALVKFDNGLHFQPGTALSNRSSAPSLLVSTRWAHPTGIVCSESGSARDKGTNKPPVATLTEGATQLKFEATAGRMYETTVHARRCTAEARDTVNAADYVWTLHQETVATYSPGWTVGRCQCWSGKSVLASDGAGRTATFKGTFTSFGLITDYGKNRGTADIFLDGVKVGSINGRSANAQTPMQVTFAVRAAANAEHTVLIKVTSGRVDVDAFMTSGPPTQQGAKHADAPLEAP